MLKRLVVLIFLILLTVLDAHAQGNSGGQTPEGESTRKAECMPGMRMPGCPDETATAQTGQASTPAVNFMEAIMNHSTSGTNVEPVSTQTPMLMKMRGRWMLMFHANAFLLDQQQSSPRGGDKFFSINWLMPMAQRQMRHGVFTVRTMLSLEPATITNRQYPLLFQQGETAYGKPIIDGQHPHDLFMELAILYDHKLSARSMVSFYVAPIGDPSLGPVAFPHRSSATENPLASLGHHQQDSTHVAADVVTAGLTFGRVRIEGSGFHGREPDENRWNINQGAIDSWSTRVTVAPAQNWSGQFSFGRIASPEVLAPDENQDRMTASVTYNRPLGGGNWASTAVWGRTKSRPDGTIFNSYLLESTLRFRSHNYVWTRIENAERSSELLLGNNPLPVGFAEKPIGHVQAYTFGYDRDIDVLPHVSTAIGAQLSVYGVPETLQGIYGTHPASIAVFVRMRPFSK
jgi:hypothetical protein